MPIRTLLIRVFVPLGALGVVAGLLFAGSLWLDGLRSANDAADADA